MISSPDPVLLPRWSYKIALDLKNEFGSLISCPVEMEISLAERKVSFDNFQCSQWFKFCQNGSISVSVHDETE